MAIPFMKANEKIPDFLVSILRPAKRAALRLIDPRGLRRAKSRLRRLVRLKQELIPQMEVRIDSSGRVFLHEPEFSLDYLFPLESADLVKIGNYEGFEERERALVSAALGESGVLVDIGANVGVFSMSAARARPRAKVYAIEPVKDNFQLCRANLERNQLETSVKLWQLALGDKETEVEIPTGVGTWQFVTSATDKAHSAGMSLEKVKQVTLDSFVNQNIAESISMIKCDVEGYELFVLRGGLHTLRQHKPCLLLEISRPFCERFSYKPEEIFSLLEPLGYSFMQILERGRGVRFGDLSDGDVDFSGANFFFFPKERAAEFRTYP